MRIFILSVTFIVMSFSSAVAAESLANPQSLRELVVLGLKTNLGLQTELLNPQKAAADTIIEESVFDSRFFAGAGYGDSSYPYASTFSPQTTSDDKSISANAGISKSFMTGLQANLSLNTERHEDNDLTNNLDPYYRTAVILDFNQPLLRNLGTAVNTTRIEVAKNQQRQAALRSLLQAQQLTLQLEAAARQIAAKTAIIALRREALELANELLAANRQRFETGVIAVTQVQEAETSVASRKLSLSQAIQQRDLLREDLNRQLNHHLTSEFTAAGLVVSSAAVDPPELPDNQQLFAEAQQRRLELKINDFSLLSSSLQRDYLDNQLKPRLDLNLQAGLNGLAGDERFSSTISSYSGNWPDSFSSMADADGYQWRVGLDFSVPLGNRAAKSRLHQAELQLKQDRYQRRDIEAAIKDDVIQQQINVTQTWQQLKIADRFEELAQRSLNQEQRRLEEGLSDTFRIIVYQNTMISAKIDRINALTRYQLALAQIDFARGKIFERHNIILAKNGEELNLEDI